MQKQVYGRKKIEDWKEIIIKFYLMIVLLFSRMCFGNGRDDLALSQIDR